MGESGKIWVDFKYERLSIFCYWCGKVDHDERDCMLWIRNKETLKAEDKQFGPWMRATQDHTQKPQLIVATKNNGGRGPQPDSTATPCEGGAYQSQNDSGTIVVQGGSHVVDGVDLTKADTESKSTLTTHIERRTPQTWEDSNFEQQIQEIDAAILGTKGSGSVPPFNETRDPLTEKPLTSLSPMTNTVSANLAFPNGPSLGPNVGVRLESLGMIPPNAKETKLGQEVFQDFRLFVMGTNSSKAQSEIKIRKGRGPTHKKSQSGRNHAGKENMQGASLEGEKKCALHHKTVMEVDVDEVGMKRKD